MKCLLIALLVLSDVGCQSLRDVGEGPRIVVGTFDSRAVALAYYRSREFKEEMEALHAEHEDAKSRGDTARMEELEARGKGQQDLTHKQGFGTWPVDDLLEKIDSDLAKIAREAGVDVIVSKWNFVYEHRGAKFVDVTEAIVAPFRPDAETLKVISQVRAKDPIAHDVIEKHEH